MRGMRKAAVMMLSIFVVVALTASGAFAARVKTSVASAPPGAAPHVIWGGLAKLISKESKTVKMSNLTTRGAVEDIRLLETGKAEFALGVATLLDMAIKGKKMFKKPYTNQCGLGPATASMFHIGVKKSSGIKTVQDLDGKRVSFAKEGSSTHSMTRTIMKLAGVKVREENLNWNVAADAIKEKRLDAFTIPNPVPSPAFVKFSTAQPITLLPVEGKILKTMLTMNKAYFPITIPANSYKGQDVAVKTVGFTLWTIAGCKVPADVVYEVTRLNYSKKGMSYLIKAHKGWKVGFDLMPALDQMKAINMKVHPGAARYWKEKGHKIPKM